MMIKAILSFYLLTPLFFMLVGITVGVCLLPFLRRTGISIILCFVAFLWLFSMPPVSGYLLQPLSKSLPMMTSQQQVDYLAVMGSSHLENSSQTPYLNLDGQALPRLLKAVELLEDQDSAHLWLGGCNDPQKERTTHSDMLYKSALALGVAEEKILRSASTCNTRSEIASIKEEIPVGASLAIVSSGFHLKRISVWARHYGLRPFYVGVNLSDQPAGFGAQSFLPHIRGLHENTWAWHEYLGILHAYFSIWQENLFGAR